MQVTVPIEATIVEVLNRFDFARVHAVMLWLNWEWIGLEGGRHVPSIEELRATAEKMMGEVDPTQDFDSIRTGGFHVTARRGKSIRIAFELTQAWGDIPKPSVSAIAK